MTKKYYIIYETRNLKNSQYSTCWIRNEELNENKKIPKSDLEEWLSKGWIKGRKIKKNF